MVDGYPMARRGEVTARSASVWHLLRARGAVLAAPGTLGHGAVEGLIAPDAANNSKEGGALLPTLLFGIPASSSMTLFLSALVALGVQPGAQLVIAQGSLVWTLMWALALANVVGALMLAMLGRWLAYLTFASGDRLVPFAIVFVVVGALFGTGDLRVLGVLFLLSIVGLLLKVAEWPRAPFAIGLVLGSVTERALNQAWALQGAAFLLRPGAIILLASIAASVAFYFARPSRLSSIPGVCPVLGESAHRRRACRHALRHLCEHDGDCLEAASAPARQLPLLVGSVGTGLSAAIFVRQFRALGSVGVALSEAWRPRVAMVGWLAVAIVSIVLAGILAGSALFVAAFLLLRERQSWAFVAPATLALPLVLYTGIEWSFGLYLYRGVFWP